MGLRALVGFLDMIGGGYMNKTFVFVCACCFYISLNEAVTDFPCLNLGI